MGFNEFYVLTGDDFMCGRFILFTGDEYEEIQLIIKEIEENHRNVLKDMKIGEIFPTNLVPIIAADENNNKTADLFKWGFPNFKQPSGVIINARGETLEEKPTFKKILYSKRCLVPACGFFEWKKNNSKKDKYLIKPREHNFFYMAGLYNSYIDKSGNPYKGFVIITTEANEEMADIHDRMPVIITEKDEANRWIDNRTTDLLDIKSLIKPYQYKLSFENQEAQLQFQI